MTKFNKILFAIVGTLWFFIIVTRIAHHYDQQRDREEYERGVMQTVIYHSCLGKYPSQAFRDYQWNLINMPDDCRYVEAVDAKLERKP